MDAVAAWPRSKALPERAASERALVARLTREGKIDLLAAQCALRLREGSVERIELVLTRLGLVREKDVADAAAAELGLRMAILADFPNAPVAPSQ